MMTMARAIKHTEKMENKTKKGAHLVNKEKGDK